MFFCVHLIYLHMYQQRVSGNEFNQESNLKFNQEHNHEPNHETNLESNQEPNKENNEVQTYRFLIAHHRVVRW